MRQEMSVLSQSGRLQKSRVSKNVQTDMPAFRSQSGYLVGTPASGKEGHFRSFRLARRVRMPSGLVYNCGHRADLDGYRRGQSQGFGYRRYCSRRVTPASPAATRCRSSRQFRWRHRISIRDTAPYSRSLNVRAVAVPYGDCRFGVGLRSAAANGFRIEAG
jgi:hypothetical protein